MYRHPDESSCRQLSEATSHYPGDGVSTHPHHRQYLCKNTPFVDLAAKSATTEQKTAVEPVTKATTTAKVEIAKPKQPIVSGWVVQLGSFSVEKNAIKLRDKLRKNGHASFVESYERDNKTSYRVRVGPELTRELANKLKIQLKKETKIDGLVMAFPG